MAYYNWNTYTEPDWDSEYDSTWEEDDTYEELKKGKPKRFREHNSWKKASMDLQNYRHGYKLRPNLQFYRNEIPFEPNGIFIEQLHVRWKNNYYILERNHNYIQWLFPLKEHGMNRCATPLTQDELQLMVNDEAVRRRFLQSYKLMLGFYGIQLVDEETGKVARAENWPERFDNLNTHTHNNLRITRILKCLGEMGYQHYQYPLVRFFLEETLCHHNLQHVKRSVLDYFMFTVKNKDERKKLVLFAWEHYEPKQEFNWGPVEVLQKIKPPCIPERQNNDINKYNDDMTEHGKENKDNDDVTERGRENEENYEIPVLGREEENYDDMTGLEKEDKYKDGTKEPESENNTDGDIDMKEPQIEVSKNDLKEDNRNKVFGKICEQKENEDDSTNTPDSERVEGLKKNSCGAEDTPHRESDGQLLNVTYQAPFLPCRNPGGMTPEQEQKKERNLTGREDNENQYKNEIQEHGRGPTEEVANIPRKKDNKDHNKYSLNEVGREISDFKEDADSEKENVGKVCKQENRENNSVCMAGLQSAKRFKNNNSEAENGQRKEPEKQQKRTTEEGRYSEKQQEDMKKPVEEERCHNDIQEHRELSEDHHKNNTNDTADENHKRHYEDNTNQPSEEPKEKGLENYIDSKNKNAGNVYKQDSSEKASVHMVDLQVVTESKNIRAKESDRSPLTKLVSQSKTTLQSVTGSECEGTFLHVECSSKKASRKVPEDPNQEKSENKIKETLQAKNVEAVEKDKEPDKCCQDKDSSGAEVKELFKEQACAANILAIETESKSSVTKSDLDTDDNMGKPQSTEKCCLNKVYSGTQPLLKVEYPAENMGVKTKSENSPMSCDLDNDKSHMGTAQRVDEALESGVAEGKEINRAAESSKKCSKKKGRNRSEKKHNATNMSNL